MTSERVHWLWTRETDPWSPWVKRVLFANLDEEVVPEAIRPPAWIRSALAPLEQAPEPATSPYRTPPTSLRDTAVVVDLPGAASALAGVGLIDLGFRPVPLYNAVPSPLAVVELRPIMQVLVDAAERVWSIPDDSPPAFLLDSLRTRGEYRIVPGSYDNRSVCRTSDFPSVDALRRAGVRRALWLHAGDRLASDLEAVLSKWQRAGLALWLATETAPAEPFVLPRRSFLARLVSSLRRELLPRRADGAYGKAVPPSGRGIDGRPPG